MANADAQDGASVRCIVTVASRELFSQSFPISPGIARPTGSPPGRRAVPSSQQRKDAVAGQVGRSVSRPTASGDTKENPFGGSLRCGMLDCCWQWWSE